MSAVLDSEGATAAPERSEGVWHAAWRRFRADRLGMASAAVVVAFLHTRGKLTRTEALAHLSEAELHVLDSLEGTGKAAAAQGPPALPGAAASVAAESRDAAGHWVLALATAVLGTALYLTHPEWLPWALELVGR